MKFIIEILSLISFIDYNPLAEFVLLVTITKILFDFFHKRNTTKPRIIKERKKRINLPDGSSIIIEESITREEI